MFEGIKARLEISLEKMVEKRAKEIYEDCIELGEYAIQQFYNAYSPQKYKRMHSFDYVCNPFIHRTGKLEYVVGIRVLEGIAGGHKDPDEYVFHGVMEMGVHGTSQIAISYPPMQVIRDYFAQF